jgi:hypothetical protein
MRGGIHGAFFVVQSDSKRGCPHYGMFQTLWLAQRGHTARELLETIAVI